MSLDPLSREHARAALDLEASSWMRLRRIFRRAKGEMTARMVKLLDTGHGDTVRAQHAAAVLFEVSAVLGESIPDLVASLAKSTGLAIDLGAAQAIAEVAEAEHAAGDTAVAKQVAKVEPSIPIDAVVRISDPQQSLLTKFGDGISEAAAESLGVSLTMGEGIKVAAKRLAEEIEGTSYRLETIARTEINNAMNAAHEAQLQQVAADFPEMDLWKQWSAEVEDGACCGNCTAMDGQVRRLDDEFIGPKFSGDAPPAHPRCRCRCQPWSPRWKDIGKPPVYLDGDEPDPDEEEQGDDTPDSLEGSAMKVYTLQAMSLDMPDTGAPNRRPFKGVLCQLDVPSTRPPGGGGGDLVILPTRVAEKILPTLLGMAVNFTVNLDGHDVRKKVGVITTATIEAGAIHVGGVIWDKDFPEVIPAIRAANKAGDDVGMSYEIDVLLVPERAGVARIKDSDGFTGAAILKCRDAAYQQTSLAASAAEGVKMTPEELAALLAANNQTLLASVQAMIKTAVRAASTKTGKAALDEDLAHAHDLHANAIKAMSGYENKDAATSMGALGEHLGHMKAAADNYTASTNMEAAATVPQAVKAETDPAVTQALKALRATIETQADEIKSLNARAAGTAEQPARVTLPPAITALLAKADMVPKDDAPVTAATVRAALDKAGVTDIATRLEALAKVPN